MAGAPILDFWRFKVFCLLNGTGADVLTFILQHGTNAPTPPVQLDEYLTNLPISSTANYLQLKDREKKKTFDPSQVRQIQNNPMWYNFDITLLFKAIRLACEDIARLDDDSKWKDQNEMEGLITRIKNERNDCAHEKKTLTAVDFQAKVDELETIYMNVLTQAKVRYSVPDNDFTFVRDKVLQDIRSIKVLTLKEILERDIKHVLPLFKEESKIHLQNLYKQAQYFDSLFFLSGSQQKINIQSIFCDTFLINKTDATQTDDIDCLDLLTNAKSNEQTSQSSTSLQAIQSTQGKNPQFIMISGDAGSGKTTLLTFIMSEWVNDTHNCRIKHLNEYDIVLRILCREKDGPSLQDFLQQALPNIFDGIKRRLLALLKECKVLFLIDGLDELSPGSSSDQLVTDILNKSKYVPGCTIICTSRPDSVNDFLVKLPDSYQQRTMEMKGVSPAHRTEFVLRHYDSFPSNSSKDPDKVKSLMKYIGWKEHFGLPLNLLFVATLLYYKPDSAKIYNTQTNLYLNIHEWCVEKLQERLTRHPQAAKDRLAREKSIRKVLKVMYHLALQGLLKDRMSLTEWEASRLRNCCRAENLPSTEIMGAFLCHREYVTLVRHPKYCMPHKSLQEFFAAKLIVDNLNKDIFSTWSIRSILQFPSSLQLYKLKNLLHHVAGLLTRSNVQLLPGAIQEVVDLLAESGVKKCDDWLSLLEDTEMNITALDRVAEHVRSEGLCNEKVNITDSTITSATALLPLIPCKNVRLELQRIEKDPKKLYQIKGDHYCTELKLWQHYKQPNFPPASDPVLHGLRRCDLDEFVGYLSPLGIIMLLRGAQNLRYLRLAVSGDRDAPAVLSILGVICPSFSGLSLWLHVPVKTVTPDILTRPLPDVQGVMLVLSGVEEKLLEKVCLIAAALQPSNSRYWRITFPDSSINKTACRRLLDFLVDAGVGVMSVRVPNTIIMTEDEECGLNNYAWDRMSCGFIRMSDDKLWEMV